MSSVPGGQSPAAAERPAAAWDALPPSLAAALRPHLAALAEEIIAAIAVEVPPYAMPLEGNFGRNVTLGVEQALRRFVVLVETRGCPPPELDVRDLYVELGRVEVRGGRTLDTLLAAYRVGARVAWRRLATVASSAGVDAAGLVALAEAIFAYIDELSWATAEGYAQEQSMAASERDRRRSLLATLLCDPTADAPRLEEAARLAGWSPPTTLAAVVVPLDAIDGLAARIGPAPLVASVDDVAVGWVADADGPGHRGELHRTLAGLGATVGPALAWRTAAQSLTRARLARELLPDSHRADGDPVWAGDHLRELLLRRDPSLVADLAAVRLAPLAELPDAARERLSETLLAWLVHRGERARVAAALHVHPQTVRYRLGQLRERFGADLEDPDVRFELELVLRAGSGDHATGGRT